MKVSSVKIENFMGLAGEHFLNLAGQGLVHIAGRNEDDPGNSSNGSGKSTFLESMTWCLFGAGLPRPQGSSERGVSGDEVLNDRIGSKCYVAVTLTDEAGVAHVVERWRKHKAGGSKQTNGARMVISGTEITALDESEINRLIEQKIGITYDVWCRSVVFSQESQFDFCSATPRQRQEILSLVMGLEEIDVWHTRCKERKTDLTQRFAVLSGKIEVKKGELVRLTATNPQSQADAWQASHQRKIDELTAELGRLEMEGKAAKERYDLTPEPIGMVPQPILPDDRERNALSQQMNGLASKLRVEESELTRLRQQIEAVDQPGAICPTCKQPMKAKSQAQAKAEAAQKYATVEAQWRITGGAYQAAEQAYQRANTNYEIEKAATQESLIAAQQANAKREAMIYAKQLSTKCLDDARAKYSEMRNRIAREQAEPNPFAKLIERHYEQLKAVQSEVEQLERLHSETNAHLDICAWWDKELPRFRVWMFDSIVDVLSNEANRSLNTMSGGVLWVNISTQKQMKTTTKDELDVVISRWNPDGTVSSRPYRMWSGGEKRRVELSLNLGLSRLMAQRAKQAYSFIALDEVDRHLDDKGKEGLRAVLEEIRKDKDTAIVITHDPEFRASFDSEITVVKSGGQSRIEVKNAQVIAAA